MSESDPLRAAAVVVDSIPGHRDPGTPAHAVAAWVSRADIAASRDEAPAAGGYAGAVRLLLAAVRQPALDAAFKRTGATLEGAAGLGDLEGNFGNGGHRKLYFGRDALVAEAASAGVAGVQALAVLKDGSAARQDLVNGRRAERAAGKASGELGR